MKFRYDISFLRAFAVISVMFFHFKIPFFQGGFLGVDVFFVISGFLMTQIIVRKFEDNSFSLLQFYKKRIIRIVPALQLLLWFVLLVSVIFLLKVDISQNAKYSFLASCFVSNIYFYKYVDYFNSADNILLHTWTLGIEWQFYMLYPLLLISLKKIFPFKRKVFFIIILSLTLLSFFLMLYYSNQATNFSFYLLPTRFWELSIGGCAFFISNKIKPSILVRTGLALTSIVVLLLSIVTISSATLWPSVYTLIPVCATFLIIVVNVDLDFFKNKFTNFLGNISYSLYLWHWVLYVLFKNFGLASRQHVILLIILSILFSYFSYKYIEGNKRIARLRYIFLSTILLWICSAFLFAYPKNTITDWMSIYQNKKYIIGEFRDNYVKTEKNGQYNPCGCAILSDESFSDYNFKKCLTLSDKKPNILLIGDSHMAQFSSSMRKWKEYNVLEASAAYILPLKNARGKEPSEKLMNYIYEDFIPNNAEKIDLIIISAHWLMQKDPNINYTNQELERRIQSTTRFFKRKNLNFLIIGQTESYTLDYPRILMLRQLSRNGTDFLDLQSLEMNVFLKKLFNEDHYIDIYRTSEVIRYDSIRLKPYMFDTNHLTKFGADQIADKIVLERVKKTLEK
jgi:peptidoglycan/LPS O-acetylase OafA/YrhL